MIARCSFGGRVLLDRQPGADRLQTQAGWRDVLPPRTADRIRGRAGALHPDNGGDRAESDNPAAEGGSPESRNRRMAG